MTEFFLLLVAFLVLNNCKEINQMANDIEEVKADLDALKEAHDAEKAANAALRATLASVEQQLKDAQAASTPPDFTAILAEIQGITADANAETAADTAAEPST